MYIKPSVIILAGTVCMLYLTPPHVSGQDSAAMARQQKLQIEKDIRSIESKIGTTDSLIRREEKRFSVLQQRLRDGIERKKSDIDTLNEQLEDLVAEINRLSGAIEQKRAGIRAVADRRAYIADRLVEQCEKITTVIRTSLPWNREERLSRVTALKNDLESGAAQIEDGLSRLLAILEEETTFGDEIVLDTRTIRRNDGSTVTARVLRIGDVWMTYVDVAEQFYGVLHRENDSTFVWNEDFDFAQREQIRTAIRVKEAKKAPQIVPLPVTVNASTARKEGN